MRKVVTDLGFNAVPLDPQTLRRDLWGACFLGLIGVALGFTTIYLGFAPFLPLPEKSTVWQHLSGVLSLVFASDSDTAQQYRYALDMLRDTHFALAVFFRVCLAIPVGLATGAVLFKFGFEPRERLTHISGKRLML